VERARFHSLSEHIRCDLLRMGCRSIDESRESTDSWEEGCEKPSTRLQHAEEFAPSLLALVFAGQVIVRAERQGSIEFRIVECRQVDRVCDLDTLHAFGDRVLFDLASRNVQQIL
tara:strand:- start:87 stop:431 length:345 start_codon:yes stop_codon:yes gene_type:complete